MADIPFRGFTSKIVSEGVDTANSVGTNISLGNGSKAGYTQITSSTSDAYSGIYVQIEQASGTSSGVGALVDIAIGAASSEQVIAENLRYSMGVAQDDHLVYYLPVDIPAGTRIAATGQADAAGKTLNVSILGCVNSVSAPSQHSVITTYGADTGNTKGTTVDAGGTAHTKGSWSQITSSTSEDHSGLFLGIGHNNNNAPTAQADFLVDIGIGAASSEQVLIENVKVKINQREQVTFLSSLFNIPIPSGTRIAARCQHESTDATDRIIDLIVYGVS